MSKPPSSTNTWLLRNRKRTDLPPSNPPSEKRNLDGIVGSLADRAANQYHRIQNLFRSSDDQEKADSRGTAQGSSSTLQAEEKPASSSSHGRRFFKSAPQPAPLQARVREIEEILGRLEILLQEHSRRLTMLEGETQQLASKGTIRSNAPDTPMSIAQDPEPGASVPPAFPASLSALDPVFVQSLANRLDHMETLMKSRERSRARPKPRVNKLTRFMGLEDHSSGSPLKRPRI
ncbi:hypothetical protein PGTUg99_021801 [Puccinia graminis f. sp. tritici]|uniref:Uncharacterized protein n=1 Tax=Puccinia graminis f. sp. tritici TaxID=56615 RepID=A0A5B0MR60_PUCGR|nr:hypothetical protein PGTUg99_021801 [Puccinia graminis f. sp. tritici]